MKIAKLPQGIPTALSLILCLFGERLAYSAGNSVGSAYRELEAVFRDRETQWMPVLCIGTYLVALSVIRNRRLRGRITPTGRADLWLGAFLVIPTLLYFLNYQRASQSTQTGIVLGGALIGSGAWVNMFRRGEPGANKQSLWRFVTLSVVMLAIACFWKSGVGSRFSYKDNARWVGPWDNPNLYGLLMASGTTLALGLARSDAGLTSAQGWRLKLWNRLKSVLFLAAAGMICFGLCKSYSRGAWLAAVIGGLYLLVRWCNQRIQSWPQTTIHYSLAIIAGALLALLFWQNQHTESPTAHRAVSASNRSDLSWRNRVSAWEGDLQMMADRPWLGMGWNQPESYYGHYYSTSRLEDTAAIQLNDYLMLGATLGIPALFCFCTYLWLTFTQSSKFKVQSSKLQIQDTAIQELVWLKVVCRTGAMVLAVGFWFDGGLFKLPTAATFWILLELGRMD